MSTQLTLRFRELGIALLATAILSACIIVEVHSAPGEEAHRSTADRSSVNSDLNVPANSHSGDLESVNGHIHLGPHAAAGDLRAVNGDITLEEGASADDVETVNGQLELRPGSLVRGDITKVNGKTRSLQARIKGDLSQVNGDLDLQQTQIAGEVDIRNADLRLGSGSRIEGDVTVGSEQQHQDKPPRIVLEAGSQIMGRLVLLSPVTLERHPDAQVGAIVGLD